MARVTIWKVLCVSSALSHLLENLSHACCISVVALYLVIALSYAVA
jgi:hypothetical protein